MTSFLGYKRDGEEAVSRVPLAARRMFDGASCATEYRIWSSPQETAAAGMLSHRFA